MSIQRQVITIPIATGIETNADPKQLQAKLLKCENGYVARQGVVQKRDGSVRFGSAPFNADPFITKHADKPLTIGQRALRVYDGGSGHSGQFDEGSDELDLIDIGREHISATAGDTYYHPDIAETPTIRVISYVAFRAVAGTYTYVPCLETFDKATGLQIDKLEGPTAGTSTTSATRRFRLVEAEGSVVAFYVKTVSAHDYIAAYVVNSSGVIGAGGDTSAVWPYLSEFTVGGTVGHFVFDAAQLVAAGAQPDTAAVVYLDKDGNITVGEFVVGTGFGASSAAIVPDDTPLMVGVSPWGDTGTLGLIGVWWQCDGGGGAGTVWGCCMDASLTVVAGDGATPTLPVQIGDISSAAYTARNIPACIDPTDDTRAFVYWTEENETGSGTPNYYPDCLLRQTLVEYDLAAKTIITTSATSTIARKVKACSRPFGSHSTNQQPFILTQYQADLQDGYAFYRQSHYFLLEVNGRVVGKSTVGMAGPWAPNAGVFQHVSDVGGHYSNSISSGYETLIGALKLAGSNSDMGEYTNDPLMAEASFQALTVTEGYPSGLRCFERISLHIPNSNPYLWDGQKLVEDGFLVYPEGLAVATSDSSGGELVVGATYQWCATYEWMDANGIKHESAPSPPIEATIGACPINGKATAVVNIPYLSLTRKENVRLVLWRTRQNGQIFYRVRAYDNDPTLDVCAVDDPGGDTAADDDLVGSPYLYTTGGRVANVQPPPYRINTVHQDRHFIVDREREDTHIWYSKSAIDEDRFEERGFEANDRMLVQVPPDGGRIVALSSYLDRLFVFKQSRIYMVTGNGLDDARQGQGYAPAVMLDPVLGCTNEKSVLQVPNGVLFLSARGIYLLGQDLNRQPVGLPVKAHTDAWTISAASVLQEKGYAIFTTNGPALVWSYVYGKWSTFTNREALDAIEFNGELWWISSATSGAVFAEQAGSYLDNSLRYSMVLRTGVIGVGIFNPERIYSIGALGQAIAACVFRLKTAYDAAPYFLDDQTLDMQTALGKYFDVAAYLEAMNDASYLDKAMMIDAGTSRQKCSAVQLELNDEQIPALVTITSVKNATTYTVNIAHGSGSATAITYLSDSSATRKEIVDGLVAAINASSEATYVTALNVSDATVKISGDSAVPFTVTVGSDLSVANGAAADNAAYSLSAFALEIGLLPGKWPSNVIGTARGM